MVSTVLLLQDPLGQLPPPASTFAPDVDGLFNFLTWLSIFSFFAIMFVLIYSAVKWRRKTEHQPAAMDFTHNTMLEVVWTLVPTVILMVIFAWGWKGNLDQTVAPGNALQHRVIAQQWFWTFYHEGDSTPVTAEVWVPVNRPVKFTMNSLDVLHSLYFPAMRTKRDVLPGRYQTMWFTPTVTGDYQIYCAEYCGNDHSTMLGTLHVVTDTEYAMGPWKKRPKHDWDYGKELFVSKTCATCHSLEGPDASKLGPVFHGVTPAEVLWGRTEELEDGSTVKVDEAYITESLREPTKKMVKGFLPIMPKFDDALLPEEQRKALLLYLNSPMKKINKIVPGGPLKR